jgi:hypothetical protein
MRTRLLAVLGAVLMIVAAVVVRGRLDSSQDGGSSGGSGSGGNGAVVCDAALGDACPDGTGKEPAGTTVSSLVTADTGPSTWLALGRWPEAVDLTRKLANRPPLFARTTAVGSTRLVLVVRKSQNLGCPQPVTWACIGDAAAQRAVVISAPPAGTSDGLIARAAFVGSKVGRPDWATNDLAGATNDWLQQVRASLDDASRLDGGTALEDWAGRRFAGPAGFVATEADVVTILGSAGGNADVDVITPQPAVTIEAVASDSPGRRYDTEQFRRGLSAAGWTTPPSPTSGLPSPDVLLALQQVVG